MPSEYRGVFSELATNLKKRGSLSGGCAGMIQSQWQWRDNPKWDIVDRNHGTRKGEAARHYKYYIFLAVGGNRRPNLSQSHPNPADFNKARPFSELVNEKNWEKNGPLSYVDLQRNTPGFTQRHEDTHSGGLDSDYMPVEYKADIGGLTGLMNAYNRWKSTGDDSGYYFVFKTPEGLVYTGDQQESRPQML